MRRLLRYGHAVVLCLLALGITLPASAQDAPTVELSGGYNFLRVQFEDFEDEKSFPAGWYVDVASNVTEMIGIVGQIGGNYKTLFDTVDTSPAISPCSTWTAARRFPRITATECSALPANSCWSMSAAG